MWCPVVGDVFDFSPLLFFQVIAMLGYFCFCCLFKRGGSALCVSPQISGMLRFSAKLCQITISNFYRCSLCSLMIVVVGEDLVTYDPSLRTSYKPASCRFALFLCGSIWASLMFEDASVLGMGFEILDGLWIGIPCYRSHAYFSHDPAQLDEEAFCGDRVGI